MNEYLYEHVGRFVQLQEGERRWLGLCPFHQEETPSFTVDTDTSTYHCFGCDAHGHVEDFAHELSMHRARGA